MKSGKNPQQHVYTSNVQDYELLGEIGNGATATVYFAKFIPTNSTVAVKIVNLEGYGTNIKEVQNEISVMIQCSHPNVVQYYSSFVDDMDLWLVMRLLDGGSVLDMMKYSEFNNGLEETAIATILKESLKALNYFHLNGHIHRDVKAGNILIDTDGTVQLADFGVSSCWTLPNETKTTFAGTPCWMAPEVMEQRTGYNQKADIWSFGITAIELATGHAPHSHLSAMKVMLAVLNSPPPSLDLSKYTHYSRSFKKMIDSCLQKEPAKRPTAEQLLKHDFFKKAKGPDFIVTNLISKMPPLSERRKAKKESGNATTQSKPSPIDTIEKTASGSDPGGWIFTKDDKEPCDLAPEPEPTEPESFEEDDINLKLRMRNKSGALHDIRFPFNCGEDTPELVSHELVEHGLVPASDEVSICNSIVQFLATKEPIRFPVVKIKDEPANKDSLIGFALLSLDDN